MKPMQPEHWKAPVLSLGQMIWTALSRSLVTAALLSLLFFGLKVVHLLSQGESSIVLLLAPSGMMFFMAWGLFWPIFLILASRSWSDRAFTVSGFLATFLGLAVLAVFFLSLAGEVGQWFLATPILVQRQNEINQQELDQIQEMKNSQARLKEQIQEQLAKVEKERAQALREAATEEEKKVLRAEFDQVIDQQREDLEKRRTEGKLISQRSLRPDTSRTGVFLYFLTNSASNLPQDAGIAPALWGSIWLGLITILFAVPVGVGAALYLEEYRSAGWLARLIQVNINNLAGVPSVVYGILGGFVFVYLFRVLQEAHPGVSPRNLLGGGLTLGLLTLPIIIVSTQEAIRAVPTSLRQGAYALGATKWQVIWTIVLPMARPGILTGTILSLSRAMGEAAPLILIGAKQFVDQDPSLLSPFTALPLQIFNWCDRPAFLMEGPDGEPIVIDIWKYNAAVASSVLLIILLSMNAVAIFLRNRSQRTQSY